MQSLESHYAQLANRLKLEQEADQQSAEAPLPRQKKRIVRYGDPNYYGHLPSHLQYLKDLPFAENALGFYPPPYQVEVDKNAKVKVASPEGNQLKGRPSGE